MCACARVCVKIKCKTTKRHLLKDWGKFFFFYFLNLTPDRSFKKGRGSKDLKLPQKGEGFHPGMTRTLAKEMERRRKNETWNQQEERDFRETRKSNTSNIYFLMLLHES